MTPTELQTEQKEAILSPSVSITPEPINFYSFT